MVVVAVVATIQSFRIFTIDALPSCESDAAISDLKETVACSQAAQLAQIRVLDVKSISEMSFDESSKRRQCKAMIELNNGVASRVTFAMQEQYDGKFLMTSKIQ